MNLTVCTWNVGDKGTENDLDTIMGRCSIVALQEMSDRDHLYAHARDHGWGTIDGDGENGKKATPVFYNKAAMRVKKQLVTKLSDPQHAPGTGPDTVKTKWAIGGRFTLDGYPKTFRYWSCHLVSGSAHGERRRLAQQQIRRLSGLAPKARGACIIGGDFNTSWNNELLAPMKKNWRTNHAADGGPVHTHDNWTPDQSWSRNAKVVDQGAWHTGSDHDALWVTYHLKDNP